MPGASLTRQEGRRFPRREAFFAAILSAFGRRDFAAMEAVLSEDPVLMFAGPSELAGTYRGIDGIDRYLVTIRDFVRPNGE